MLNLSLIIIIEKAFIPVKVSNHIQTYNLQIIILFYYFTSLSINF